MWAGGEIDFLRPIAFGDIVERRSLVRDITRKTGRTGDLVFVTLAHELLIGSELAIRERQDLVYRAPASTAAQGWVAIDAQRPRATWIETIQPNPVLLFRYSALTFNSHRIHYDLAYASKTEGYPRLVVQGPLQATFLAELASRSLQRPLASFRFRSQAPAFEGAPLYCCADPDLAGISLWIEQAGSKTMTASAG
jgi:3-methylfumaryl-CoA hydratase